MKQRVARPDSYPKRSDAGDDPMNFDDKEYAPVYHEDPILSKSPRPTWADPPNLEVTEVGQRTVYSIDAAGELKEFPVSEICKQDKIDKNYLNPLGKTGISGRGKLGKYGPNTAVDAIVTRVGERDRYEVLLVMKREGDHPVAFPAGMVEEGVTLEETLRRELNEEAVRDRSVIDRLLDLKDARRVVYAGIVDDWRNTDHAWMQSVVTHVHIPKDSALMANFELAVADQQEIESCGWYPIEAVDQMYASHIDWLKMVYTWLMSRDDGGHGGGDDKMKELGFELSTAVDKTSYTPDPAPALPKDENKKRAREDDVSEDGAAVVPPQPQIQE